MKHKRTLWVTLLALSLAMGVSLAGCASGGARPSTSVADDDRNQIKQALAISTRRALQRAAQPGGFAQDSRIRIPLPDPILKGERILRMVGYAALLDSLAQRLNRTAEQAALDAEALFFAAIRRLECNAEGQTAQAENLAQGTCILKAATYARLQMILRPVVHATLYETEARQTYCAVMAKMRAIPRMQIRTFDLDQFVTDKTLDGLFVLIAEEEAKMRRSAAGRQAVKPHVNQPDVL
jgi:hypothetical protein